MNEKTLFLAATLLLAPVSSVSFAADRLDGAQFEVHGGRRQLFLDDAGVDRIDNLTRSLHRPHKRGAVLRSPQPSQTVQIRTSPVWVPERRRWLLWVNGIEPTVWESNDALNWQSVRSSNLRVEMVVYDPLDRDPQRRFKAALENSGFAVSPDGMTWKALDVPAIRSSDESNFSYDPARGLFVHSVKRHGPNGRSVAIAISSDFRSWKDLGVVFHADAEDQRLGRKNIEARLADRTLEPLRYTDPEVWNVDVYNMGVFWYESLFIGMPALFHATGKVPNYPNTDGFHLIQLVTSRDLKTWNRVAGRQTFIGPSRVDSGAYDLTQILPPSAPIIRDDELWFYYTGLKWRSTFDYVGTYPNGQTVPVSGKDRDTGGVCLATIRRDGFVSLDASDRSGTLLSKRFVVPPGRLVVNVDAKEGQVTAALCDPVGAPLPGFEQSEAIRVDGVTIPVVFKRRNSASLTGKTVRLKLTARRTRIYAYAFEK